MLQLMYESNGIGLAGPQVGKSLRLFVTDCWWPQTGSRQGCLSLPGVNEFVTRSRTCHVEALGLDGKPFALDADGLLAICIQHENDHLDGFTIAERVGRLTRRMIQKQLPSVMPPPLPED
jgi:peptide deformylase